MVNYTEFSLIVTVYFNSHIHAVGFKTPERKKGGSNVVWFKGLGDFSPTWYRRQGGSTQLMMTEIVADSASHIIIESVWNCN